MLNGANGQHPNDDRSKHDEQGEDEGDAAGVNPAIVLETANFVTFSALFERVIFFFTSFLIFIGDSRGLMECYLTETNH